MGRSESRTTKASVKQDRSLLSGYTKFSRAIRREEKIFFLVIPHIVVDTPDFFYIRTLFAGVLEPFVSGQSLDAVYMGKLDR